jgi:hypothetical protein
MSDIITYSPTTYWQILNTTDISSEGVEELLQLQYVLKNINPNRLTNVIKKDIRVLAAIIEAKEPYAVLDFIDNKALYSENQTLMQEILYSDTVKPSVEQLRLFIKDIAKGYSVKESADRRDVPLRTAYKYDKRFGFSRRFKDNFLDFAIHAVEDELTVEQFASKENLTYYKAQSLMTEAKKVLKELGL